MAFDPSGMTPEQREYAVRFSIHLSSAIRRLVHGVVNETGAFLERDEVAVLFTWLKLVHDHERKRVGDVEFGRQIASGKEGLFALGLSLKDLGLDFPDAQT